MPIYKRCSRCNNRILAGTICPCMKDRNKDRHREYDRFNRDKKSKAFYNSADWRRVKDYVLGIDEIDVYTYMTKGVIIAADTVHHIIPVRDDWSRRLETANLISIHSSTHSKIEQQYKKDKPKMEKILSEMVQEFRKLKAEGAV